MVKRVNIGVFNVLKSIVDYKAAVLPNVVRAGQNARADLPDMEESLRNLSEWERRESRYGRPKYEPGEKTPDDYVCEIEAAKCAINAGVEAANELKAVDKFYGTYNLVLRAPEIENLRQELYETEAWQEHWRSKMYAGATCQDDEQLSESAHCEMEYNEATKRVNALKARLAEIQKIR